MTWKAMPARQLVSQQDAAVVARADVPRSKFVGSWTRKTCFDAGYLIPIMLDEVLPGDHLTYDVTAFVRMATPLFPLMDNQRIDTFFFYVPNRLLWTNWVRFMGEQDTPSSSINYTVPVMTHTASVADIYDHMGIPPGTAGALEFNCLPFRAYNLIWNEWFRDQNIQDAVTVPKTDGPDAWNWYTILRRAKSHDYFTSALPWPQKFTAPTLPLLGTAPVLGIGFFNPAVNQHLTGPVTVSEANGGTRSYGFYRSTANAHTYVEAVPSNIGRPNVYADLAAATGISIETMRNAWMVQSLMERDARGGTRYVELIKSHFGVTNPDFRLQRPEYIGGGQTPLQLTPVAQTAPATGSVVGQLGAAGTAVGQHRASFAATEHGYILGLINVKSDLSYQQGMHKMFRRRTRYDFYWPALAGLGEQPIYRQEIYAVGGVWGTADGLTFGYQERWHEYRTRYSDITSKLRSTASGTLDMWHLAQNFTAPPTLSSAFIGDEPPMTRVLAAGALATNQQYVADILFRRTAVRPIPMFGTPATLGRF